MQKGSPHRRLDRLASWWHIDAELGREIECVNHMTKSRDPGFVGHEGSRASFLNLFTQLRTRKIVP